MPIRIAAKVDKWIPNILKSRSKPLLDHPLVEFISERAHALLFSIDWPEPFGLVMIEAMACGIPVIAFRNGSVAEIIEDGRTGFVMSSIEEAADAVRRVESLGRAECRRSFEKRFTASRMAKNYIVEYLQVRAPDYVTVAVETR